jgi:hypothetical protein
VTAVRGETGAHRWDSGHRRSVIATLVVVLGATLAGCVDGATPSPAPTPTRAPEPTPLTTTYSLDKSVWYEGLKLRFGLVTATLDARGGPVTLNVQIENPTDDLGTLDGKIRLVIGGTPIDSTRESVVPDVPAQGTKDATLAYELQGVASIDDATIEVGEAPLHVATVPLTPAAGEAVAFEPVKVGAKGTNTAGSVKITLQGGVLRWDLPDWSQELDAKRASLTLTYDVTYAGDFAGGLAFTGENVALRLPDGKIVEARKDGHSQSVELIGARKTKKSLFSRFEIPSDATGKFSLLVRSGTTVKTIGFTIGG